MFNVLSTVKDSFSQLEVESVGIYPPLSRAQGSWQWHQGDSPVQKQLRNPKELFLTGNMSDKSVGA